MAVRNFARWFGLLYLLVGVVGFIPGLTLMTPPGSGVMVGMGYGEVFGLFPVNVLHDVVHLAIGAWGVAGSRSFAGAIAFARGLAIVYGVLTICGVIPGLNTLFGLTPLFSWDVVLHAVSALAAAYFGWGAPARTATAR